MTEARRRQTSRPTAEQKAARGELAVARKNELARKQRTRELIRIGEVLADHGFTKPEQVDKSIRVLSERDSWVEWLRRQGVDLSRAE